MTKTINRLVNIFKALASETRLKIVIDLLEKERNVNLMAEKLNIAQPNISQHLTILKNAGIIKGFRKGTQVCYRVIDKQTEKIIKSISLNE